MLPGWGIPRPFAWFIVHAQGCRNLINVCHSFHA